jgi:outer membrane protein insertion porin family/translocation and assembly module TamA
MRAIRGGPGCKNEAWRRPHPGTRDSTWLARGLAPTDPMGVTAGRIRAAVVVAAVVVTACRALAVPIDDLDPEQPWVLDDLVIRGAEAVSAADVREVVTTQPRAWWAPWRARPALDPPTLREDVDRVRALYRRRGYYEAAVVADATVGADGHDVGVVVTIAEGAPVRIADVTIAIDGPRLPTHEALLDGLPLRRDAVFEERDYQAARRLLRRAYRDAGYARVIVDRRARVDLDTHLVTVGYSVTPGPLCVFGAVEVTGTHDVDPDVVRAEVAFAAGDPFRDAAIERTRARLQATQLFQTLRIEEEPGTSPVVDVHVDVREAPPRDVRVALGYDTEEGPRAIAGWRHYDFMGGGRQLGVTARASLIERSAAVDFLQPHWPIPDGRTRLLLAHQQEDEDSYDLARSSFTPRLEWQPRPDVTAFLFDRIEYDTLTHVPIAVGRALPHGAPRHSVLSGLGAGVDAVVADDPLDPKRGYTVAFTVDGAGLGGDVHLVRAVAQGAVYHPLGFLGLFAAARLRLGVVAPVAGDPEVPLFERFYAGGTGSVRGYERRHVGPLADGDPIGGRSLVEMSAELRRTIVGNFGGVLFVDAGQVGLRDDSLPFDDLAVGTGVGVRYASPVGPIRLDLGFPLDRPRGDASFQVHVSLGRAF